MDQSLVYQLEKLNDSIDKLNTAPSFSESLSHAPEYSEGFKDLGIMAIGGAISPIVSNLINKFLPVGNLAPVIAGFGLKVIVKQPMAQKIADGLIIASLSTFISGLMAGRVGFGEGTNDDRETSFSEMRVGGVNFG